MSIPAGNGATGASGTSPALGYALNLFWFNFLFMLISKNNMTTCTYLIHTFSLIYAMKLLVIFGIKIYRKLPSYLTRWILNILSNCWIPMDIEHIIFVFGMIKIPKSLFWLLLKDLGHIC